MPPRNLEEELTSGLDLGSNTSSLLQRAGVRRIRKEVCLE